MKVKKLIEILNNNYDPDTDVYFGTTDFKAVEIKGVVCSLVDMDKVVATLISKTEKQLQRDTAKQKYGFDPRIHYDKQRVKKEKKQ